MEVDYYSLLGISPHATRREIKVAYRRMAEVYHPDKLRELPPKIRSEGEDIMRLLNEAKSVLLDPDKRYLYDLRLGTKGSREDAIIVKEFDQAVAYEPDYVIALEKEEVRSRMSRVLSNLREVFVKDREFQSKINVAEDVAEARIVDEPKFKIRTIESEEDDSFETVIEGEEERNPVPAKRKPRIEVEEESNEVEMTLEFARVTVDKDMVSSPPRKKKKKKEFKIVAVEGDDDDDDGTDGLDEFEVQEVEWED